MVSREHENAAHEPHRIRPRLDRWLDEPNEARYERVFGDYSSVHALPHTQTFAREPLAPSSGRRVSRGRHGARAVPAPIASHCSQDPGRARCKPVGRRGVRGGSGGDGPGSHSRSRWRGRRRRRRRPTIRRRWASLAGKSSGTSMPPREQDSADHVGPRLHAAPLEALAALRTKQRVVVRPGSLAGAEGEADALEDRMGLRGRGRLVQGGVDVLPTSSRERPGSPERPGRCRHPT